MKQEKIDELQSLLDADSVSVAPEIRVSQTHSALVAALYNLAPDLLEAARELNKLQELRKKWGGDDYGSLTTSQHFDCYCEDQAEELSEVKEENLRLREAMEKALSALKCHTGDSTIYTQRACEEALGKESA